MKQHTYMKTDKLLILYILLIGMIWVSCNKGEKQERILPLTQTPIVEQNGIIVLQRPDTALGLNVMRTLYHRKSAKAFDESKEVNLEMLSNVLWAGFGVNRSAFGKRTAPSAYNAQDIDLYVCTKEGVFIYYPQDFELRLIEKKDVRQDIVANQMYAWNAPISIVLVSNLNRFPYTIEQEEKLKMAMMNACYISANIGMFCASVGLATTPRADLDIDRISTALHLNESQLPILSNPVGYE